jgi:site-specific DNA-methyltransferase (adenine-specific)
MDDNTVDSIVCDPPYGLSFMGSKWDYDVPSVEIWRECLRVLKHGGHLLAFSGTRTYHRMVVNIEDAGFEVRDCIQWLYGSGFPKSLNVGGGWGTALKPANEPICLARKPLIGTVAENILEYGTGAMNIDGCRVGDIVQDTSKNGRSADKHKNTVYESGLKEDFEGEITVGRWPANVIFDEEAAKILDEQSGFSRSAKPKMRHSPQGFGEGNVFGEGTITNRMAVEYGDSGGASRFFYCAKANKKEREAGLDALETKLFGQSGGAQAALGREEDEYDKDSVGLNVIKKRKNNHPTVKPVDLMRYLCRLITPPEGIVLDPFMGSGTTGIAACLEGFNFVGIELDEDYLEIARHRIAHWGDYEITESDTLIPQKRITEWL